MESLEDKVNEAEYQQLPDWQIAELLNTPDPNLPPVESSLKNADVLAVLIANNLWANILSKASNDQSPDNVLCINIRDSIYSRDYVFDFTNSLIKGSFETILTQAVTTGLIPQNVATMLISMGYRYQSWAEYNNIEVTARTVGIAKGGRA